MSCGKVYQASEVNKLFLMRFASIHGEASYLGLAGAGGGGGGVRWELWWMDLLTKMCTV